MEDDTSLSERMVAALEQSGYTAVAAPSLREGLKSAVRIQPDVVVSDVHLGDADGRDLLEVLRHDENLQDCQFVIMTGDVAGASQRSGMNLGADDYLAKPFSLEEFLTCIETRMKRRSSSRRAEERFVRSMRDSLTLTLPHEFLTPLNGIIGLSEFLQDPGDELSPAAVAVMAKDIHDCGTQLLRTIHNYLTVLDVMDHPAAGGDEVGWIEAEDVELHLGSEAALIAETHGRRKDLELGSTLLATGPVRLDGKRFTAVAHELIDNAFKFSRPGSPVRLRLSQTEAGVELAVEDQGRGLTSEQIRRISAFRQFDRKRYEQQGLGLGLTLAQQLLDRDGGALRLAAAPVHGTLAAAFWPAQPPSPHP